MSLCFLNLHLLCLFVVITGVVTSSLNFCDDRDLKRCMKKAKALLANQELVFAETEDKLTESCRRGKETLDCIGDFVNRCFDPVLKETYRTLTAGANTLFSELCTVGSPFRAEYLEHAECFQSVDVSYKKCAANFFEGKQIIRMVSMSLFEKMKRSCCLFDRHLHCTRAAISSKCGAKAADMGEKIITKTAGPVVKSYCSSYKFNSPECTTVSLTAVPGFLLKSNGYHEITKRFARALEI